MRAPLLVAAPAFPLATVAAVAAVAVVVLGAAPATALDLRERESAVSRPGLDADAAGGEALRLAQADEAEDAEDAEEKATDLPDREVKVGGAVVGDSVGGATGFVFKQGFYTQSDLGGFFRLGGYTINQASGGVPDVEVATSQLQPFIGLSVGYDIFSWLGVQASFGTGFVANAAPYSNRSPNVPRDYGLTFLDAGIVGQYYFLDRLALALKLSGGATFMTPEPDVGEPTIGGNALVGLGVRWASLLPDTFVGLDGNFHAAFIPDSGGGMLVIPAFSFAPVIKYVF
jgi:hypothetical protein